MNKKETGKQTPSRKRYSACVDASYFLNYVKTSFFIFSKKKLKEN